MTPKPSSKENISLYICNNDLSPKSDGFNIYYTTSSQGYLTNYRRIFLLKNNSSYSPYIFIGNDLGDVTGEVMMNSYMKYNSMQLYLDSSTTYTYSNTLHIECTKYF